MGDGTSESTVEKIVRLRNELARAKADNQAIIEVNNGLRDAMLKMKDIINATVK
jgi:phage terminase Nu1 subunit (DNA packaging protein)